MNAGTSIIATNTKDLLSWARGNSIWTYALDLSCCGVEFQAATSPRYDWERFGASVQADPKNADLLIVAGPVTGPLAQEIRGIYERMLSPKFVISMGSCANTGGIFADHSPTVVCGVDQILPVDVYVPGCPPRPEALIHALIALQTQVFAGRALESEAREAIGVAGDR